MFILEISTFMVNQGCVLLNKQLFMPTIYCNIITIINSIKNFIVKRITIFLLKLFEIQIDICEK